MKELTVNTSNLRNRVSSSRRLVLKSALALSTSISSSALWAADDKFPSKPIKVLVGFPPGGAIDLIMRRSNREIDSAFTIVEEYTQPNATAPEV